MQIESWPGRVFITGASGFLGKALARRFRAGGSEVCGVDLREDPEAGIVAGDISRPGPWTGALAGADLVIHTAAVVSMSAAPGAAWAVNVKGTRVLLAAAQAAGASRFLHVSSIAAFGWDFPDGADEDHPLMPNGNTYTDSKIASEHAVLAAHAAGAMDCTIVRPGDVYGPESVPWVILPLQMMRKRQFVLPDGGRGMFSPVYISDLVDGIIRAACLDAGRGEIFTISGSGPVSCAEFFGHHAGWLGRRQAAAAPKWLLVPALETARKLIQSAGGRTELCRGTMDILSRPGGYSIGKARQRLGYEPQVALEDGMRTTAEWARGAGLLPG